MSPESSSTGSRLACATRRGGDHVGRARPDRAGATMICRGASALAKAIAASAIDCSFWPRQVGSSSLTGLQRLAEAGDVAVAEDREHAGEQRHLAPVDLGALGDQLAHQRLRHGEADGLHCSLPSGALLPVCIGPIQVEPARPVSSAVASRAQPTAHVGREKVARAARQRKTRVAGTVRPPAPTSARTTGVCVRRHTPFRAGADGADPVKA